MQTTIKTEPNQTEKILATVEKYLQEIVAPSAAEIDRNSEILRQMLLGMGDRSLLALKVPQNFGGAGFKTIDYHRFQMLMARYSGALTFLQTQHQSAGSMLAASNNQDLKQRYLPHMSTGKILVGVGFSQLRRPGDPMMTAEEVEGGYLLSGNVPWITGFGFFNNFIVGATLADGREIYGLLPLDDKKTKGLIKFSPSMELIAMNSTNTVSAEIKKWFLENDRVVAIKPSGSIHENSKKNILHHGFYAVGCAQAGLDIIQNMYRKKQLLFLQETYESLQQELNNCRQEMLSAVCASSSEAIDRDIYEKKLQLRALAINLAGRCSQAAVIASSGAANDRDHPAGRVYREALLFSVSGQTTAVMEESLRSLY